MVLAAMAVARPARLAPMPADNPTTAAKVALGRRLFYDADLSADGTMSCGTCHEQRRGFAEGNATHPGVHGEAGRRNAPGLANVAFRTTLTWANPTLKTLEGQVRVPVLGLHPVELGMAEQEAELARRLSADACYPRQFRAAFPGDGRIDLDHVAKALAAFERTLISTHSGYDADLAGRGRALDVAARAGLATFQAQGCAGCHSGPDLTDDRFHAIAPPRGTADRGLVEITGRPSDIGLFRTPGLRNVAVTAPYLHDGSAPTLADAIRRHATGAALSPPQINALVAFLATLTDPVFLSDRRFALPRRACR